MSTHVVGFRPPDETWEKMKAAWIACESAGVEIPDAVSDFFEDEAPGDKPGAEVDISSALRTWKDESRHGFELDLSKLPENVKIVRFFNAW